MADQHQDLDAGSFIEFRTQGSPSAIAQIAGVVQFVGHLEQQSIPLVALMSASAVIMAPIEEELLYRVIFQGTLQRHVSPLGSILISSVIFSSVHGFPDAFGLFPLALILGYLYWRTGSYLTIVTTHAMFNGVTLLLTLLSPQSGAVNG